MKEKLKRGAKAVADSVESGARTAVSGVGAVLESETLGSVAKTTIALGVKGGFYFGKKAAEPAIKTGTAILGNKVGKVVENVADAAIDHVEGVVKEGLTEIATTSLKKTGQLLRQAKPKPPLLPDETKNPIKEP